MIEKQTLEWSMDANRPGVDSDPDNPFNRSLSRLINTGKPFSRLALSFLADNDHRFRWFGVFVEGKRTVFFPGFSTAFDGIEGHRGQNLHARRNFEFDHLSLEHDRSNWHITARGSLDHLGSPKTLPLGNGRVLWFGLSFGSLDAFRPMLDSTVVDITAPPNDADRRQDVIRAAREEAQFPIFSLSDGPFSSDPSSYFHASVIAGPSGFDNYLGPEHAFPIGSPYLKTTFPSELKDFPTRIHRLHLSSYTDLQITTMRIPGKLSVPVTFTSSEAPIYNRGQSRDV